MSGHKVVKFLLGVCFFLSSLIAFIVDIIVYQILCGVSTYPMVIGMVICGKTGIFDISCLFMGPPSVTCRPRGIF